MKKRIIMSYPAQGIQWDLSDLYQSMDDPKIKKDQQEVNELVKLFTHTYKGKINVPTITSEWLVKALKTYEAILERVSIYGSYASYLYTKNTQDEKIGKFYQASQEFANLIQTQLLWFDLEIIGIPEKTFLEICKSDQLVSYLHYLTTARVFKPFTLSEKEEMILTRKSQTSSAAFVRLYDQLSAGDKYELQHNGKKELLSYSQIAPYATTYPDRKVRQSAAEALSNGLEKQAKLYTFILNTLLLDKKITDEIRGYTYPQEATLLSYEIKSNTVRNMTETIVKHYSISERFYEAKKKVLGLDQLHEWDRYSPIFLGEEKKYSWNEAKEIILTNFEKFSSTFAQIAEKFFLRNWIDAEITPGKRDGAYCSYNTPSKHPYITLNFDGTMRSVETLAHELGHGIHGYLAGEQHSILEAWPSTATAEIASVFCETVVFESLYAWEKNPKKKMAMLADKIQSNFATIFRQNAFYLFESDVHEMRRKYGELSTEQCNDVFQKRMQPMFGKGLQLTDGHKSWWMPILHFYHYNFYVFSYAFGQMMTMALYAKYKQDGSEFVQNYSKALSMGGSENPYVITKTMGVDVNAEDFWSKGLRYIEQYVDEFVKLSKNSSLLSK